MFIKSLICARCQIANCVFVSSSFHLYQKTSWNTLCSDMNSLKIWSHSQHMWLDECFLPVRDNSYCELNICVPSLKFKYWNSTPYWWDRPFRRSLNHKSRALMNGISVLIQMKRPKLFSSAMQGHEEKLIIW